MPVEHEVYRRGLSVRNLYDQLRTDANAYPDSMGQRFEGWAAGAAPVGDADARSAVAPRPSPTRRSSPSSSG